MLRASVVEARSFALGYDTFEAEDALLEGRLPWGSLPLRGEALLLLARMPLHSGSWSILSPTHTRRCTCTCTFATAVYCVALDRFWLTAPATATRRPAAAAAT